MPNEWRPLSRIIINGVEYQVTDEIVQGLLEVISENNTEVSLRINDLNARINNNYSYVQDITSFLPSYANVISDWNETDSTVYTYIKNKPSIPTLVNANWNESDSTSAAYIQNKPNVPNDSNLVHKTSDETIGGNKTFTQKLIINGAASGISHAIIGINPVGSTNDFSWIKYEYGKPGSTTTYTLQEALNYRNNVQVDWNISDSTSYSYIKNKPTIPSLVNANWNESDSSSPAYILNKPSITQDHDNYMMINPLSLIIDTDNGFGTIDIDGGLGLTLTSRGNNIVFNSGVEEDELKIHGAEGVFIEGANNKNIKLTTSGNGKAYYNNNEIATKNDIPTVATTVTQNDTNPVSGGAVYDKFEDLIGAAPAALDTLAEIASALNNDADLAGTLTSQIGAKIPKVSNPTTDNFASFNSDGTIKDSGVSGSSFITTETQPDWNETNTSSAAYIQNKPTIPNDSNLVHKTGNETISGTKRFNDNIYFHGEATGEIYFNDELHDSQIRLKDDGDKGWVQIIKGNGTTATTLQAALDERNNVQADWNQTVATADDYIKNKPIVRTIINLENELPSRLFSAIGEENAITLTTEEASKFALFESKVRSRIDSNGYAYIYYYRGSEWEIDIDSLYNSNEYYFVTYELGIHTYVTIMTNGSYEENDNVWIDTNYGSLDFVLTRKNVATTVTQNDTNPVSGGAVYAKFADLIGAAPAALDTLAEIATALNNDADLAGTLTSQIGAKIPKVSNPTTDNFASFNSDGTIKDSGHSHSDYITSIKTVNNESLVGGGNIVISGLPQVSAADNGKILMVVNGQWQLVSPSVLYTGQGVPNNAQGNNGDIYMQTD